MATYTPNLNLKKPSTGEKYDVVADLNDAKDKIDNEIGLVKSQLAEFVTNVKNFGAKGDGITDDTIAIQNALDNTIGNLYFPSGTYKVSGTGEYCLIIRKNVNIIADSPTTTVILGSGGVTTNLLKIAIVENGGNLDVRHWSIKNIAVRFAEGGFNAILIKDGFQIMSSAIENCDFMAANGGYSIYCDQNLSHSRIVGNTLQTEIYMKCYDANVIEKNMFFGWRTAITFDCEEGVYNNTVRENTIVNKMGAVHIINGDAIRIENNQIEQSELYGINTSLHSTMIWVEGWNRTCANITIENNNFGGGTNVDHLIYVNNAYKTYIGKNQLIPCNISEIHFTELAKHCIYSANNTIRDQVSNPRPDKFIKAKISDLGLGTVGVLKDSSTMGLENGWLGGEYFKDENGVVHFTKAFQNGSSGSGLWIGVMPIGFRPLYWGTIPVSTSLGVGYLTVDQTGNLKIGFLPSNSDVVPLSFLCGENN